MARLLGIDVGTSSLKAILIDEKGQVLKSASADYPLSTPHVGWAEQNPDDWWRACQTCLDELGETPDAIGLTGQMHGSVFLDGDGRVLRPALLWCDQRTLEECQEITRTCGLGALKSATCNPMLPGFQAPKVLWLRNHEPESFAKVRHVLLPKDFIGYKLTGAMATEPSDASGTGVFDVPRRQWSSQLLDALKLDARWFPDCVESWEQIGTTSGGTPVVAGAGDQAAGAVGVGAVKPGVVSLSMGTSGVAFGATERPVADPTGSAHVFCHATGGWHAMGVTLSCGGAVRWARDVLFPTLSFDDLTALAATSPAGSFGATFLTYLAGERCPDIAKAGTGSFAGLSLSTTAADLARSVFEGTSFTLAACTEVIGRLGCVSDEVRLTGGGATSEYWAQMMADVLQKTCVTLEVDEGPAMGAAILAGVGIGVWNNVEAACAETVRFSRDFKPSTVDYRQAREAHKSLYPALKDWSVTRDTIE